MLTEGYRELIQYNEDIIDSAARILKLATRYLWLSEYIDIGHDAIASKIDEYIQTHLSEKITVSTICQAVNIPKKRLYSVSSQNFGIPIDYNIEVDFSSFSKVIDMLGGVVISLSDEEAEKYMKMYW